VTTFYLVPLSDFFPPSLLFTQTQTLLTTQPLTPLPSSHLSSFFWSFLEVLSVLLGRVAVRASRIRRTRSSISSLIETSSVEEHRLPNLTFLRSVLLFTRLEGRPFITHQDFRCHLRELIARNTSSASCFARLHFPVPTRFLRPTYVHPSPWRINST
jgi:hypothetical protein